MRLLSVVLAALAVAVCLPEDPAEAASRGRCKIGAPQPRCFVWRGTVPYPANDGDTLGVRLDGSKSFIRVRISGVQAMELTRHSVNRAGECHGVEAADRIDALLDLAKRKVRLSASDPDSGSRGRPLRHVAVKVLGKWVDLGAVLLGEGHALWVPHRVETAWNRTYSEITQQQRTLGANGLWDAGYCGPGPFDGVPLQVWVNSDPEGADLYATEDEWIAVRNNDPLVTVDLSGWWVRDSGLRRYTFAPGTLLAPGQSVRVRVGRGTDTVQDRYWNLRKPVFENTRLDPDGLGDGGYLFDPQGDLRASMVYPCRTVCTDPYEGTIEVEAKAEGAEYVTLTNHGTSAIDLESYRLASGPHGYPFPPDTVLAPGERLRVDVRGFPEDDEPGHLHWGNAGRIFNNRSDLVRLETFDDIVVACDSWGTRSCG